MFLDELNEDIVLCITGIAYPIYQLARDVALELKRQIALRGTKW